MAQGDPKKWSLPGWRIEQRYANGVLIGNWSEERNKWAKGRCNHTSTHRFDYKNNSGFKPDIYTRRNAMVQNEGLSNNLIFSHHNADYSSNLVSWYDEHFNKRERGPQDALPALRHWDSHTLSWQPEKTDHPLKGAPTNFGLAEKTIGKWGTEQSDAGLGNYGTTYGSSFSSHPMNALVTNHFSPPKAMSTRMHPMNKINKDLGLRSVNVIQTPEQVLMPSRMPTAASNRMPTATSSIGPTHVSV
ncbi:cilia- and flagella-associated protein 107-like [Amphiura filiformis]|uniref:cilia- and flagella-associated protein 107-like n=1 Tax=Amphiura filiformis TaxID=82378 RepID=UPI003B21582B